MSDRNYNPKEDRPVSKVKDEEIVNYVKLKYNTSQVCYDDLERLSRNTDAFYEKIARGEKVI